VIAAIEYWVYENYPNNKAVGHQSTCSHFKKNGGKAPATGLWHGPYDSKGQAASVGRGTVRPFHWCSFC
jgi:hypothetical protein